MFSKMLAAALIALGVSASAAHAQVVTRTADAGPGTLRAAINQANANANPSVITFNLPASSNRTIVPLTDLPPFTAPVEINGSGVLIDAVNTTRGLELTADNSLIQGFTIHDSSGAAAADGLQVVGNWNQLENLHVGTDVTGQSLGFGNLTTGIDIVGNGNLVEVGVMADTFGDGVAIAGNGNRVMGARLGLPYGGGPGNAGNGVAVTGDQNVIGGPNAPLPNVISGNNGHGVEIAGDDNRVVGNLVGLDETAVTGPGNAGDGVRAVGDGNVVRGNSASRNDAGVHVEGIANLVDDNELHDNNASGVHVAAGQANRVEANRAGSPGLPNADGVLVESSFNVVSDNELRHNLDAGVKVDGGSAGPPAVGNVIAGNEIAANEQGVVIEDAHRNAITGNVIKHSLDEGVLIEAVGRPNADGNWLTGNTITINGLSGVRIAGGDGNLVGQPDHAVNTITDNGGDGVTVETGQDNAVVNNSISGNADLGIDLAADGATANDGLLDPDAGPNGLQNHPRIDGRAQRFVSIPGPGLPTFKSVTDISWTLQSTASTDYRLELYGADACDASGRGEAPDLLEDVQVTTDATGLATGTITLPTADVPAALAMSATVSDPNGIVLGSTSELLPCG